MPPTRAPVGAKRNAPNGKRAPGSERAGAAGKVTPRSKSKVTPRSKAKSPPPKDGSQEAEAEMLTVAFLELALKDMLALRHNW